MSPSSTATSRTDNSIQPYSLALFRGALHPEFFAVEGRRQLTHADYDFEAWIYPGGHVLRFEHNGFCLTEVMSDSVDGLPDRGHVTTIPCAGERDFDQDFADRVTYLTSIQTETLSGHLYLATYNELLEHGRKEAGSMYSTWTRDGNEHPSLSLVDMQRYSEEVHQQAYHLRGETGLVLRSQTIFQIKRS